MADFEVELFKKSNSDSAKNELIVEFRDEIFPQHEELLLELEWTSLEVVEVVRHLADINFHLATWIEWNTKILEKFIISIARDGVVVDVVGWFSDIYGAEVLHTEGDAQAEVSGGIDLLG